MAKDVLSLLRAAKRADADAFEEAIRAYLETGDAAIAPKAAGRKKRITETNYALLLADVLNRPYKSEARKLRELAGNGLKYGNADGQIFYWLDANTIKTHLDAAKLLADESPEFAERVEFYRWALRVINA